MRAHLHVVFFKTRRYRGISSGYGSLAKGIHKKVHGIHDVTVWIISQIGQPIFLSQVVTIEVILVDGVPPKSVHPQIQRQVQSAFTRMKSVCQALARGVYAMC